MRSGSPTATIENPDSLDLTQREYQLIRRLVYAQSGINLGPAKTQLVRGRLGKLVRAAGVLEVVEDLRAQLARELAAHLHRDGLVQAQPGKQLAAAGRYCVHVLLPFKRHT